MVLLRWMLRRRCHILVLDEGMSNDEECVGEEGCTTFTDYGFYASPIDCIVMEDLPVALWCDYIGQSRLEELDECGHCCYAVVERWNSAV